MWGHTRGFDILIFNIPRVGLIFQAKSPIIDLMYPGTLTHVTFVVYKKSMSVHIRTCQMPHPSADERDQCPLVPRGLAREGDTGAYN